MSPVDTQSPDFSILDFKTKKSALISVIALSLLATGLYGSFQVVMAICGMDADTSHSLIVWQGVRTHGLSWIRDWLFTQDNWLLSLFPFHFLGFWIFGPKVSVAIISGWLIFLLSAFFSGAVAWRAGAKRAAIFIFLSLLHMGFYGYAGGLAAYSTTHNITNLYGLAALLILVNWSMKPNHAALCLLLAVLVSGAVSDPWMLAAYNLPILILSLICLVRPTTRMGRSHSAKLFIVTVISILSVKTQLFGLLDFLPDMHFKLGNLKTLNSNAVFLVRDLGGLLNLVPFANWNHFLPALLSLLAVWCLIQYSIFKTLRIRNGWNEDALSLFTVALFSIGGITTAFVISSVEAQDNSARFLINCVYLVIIAMGILAERNWKTMGTAGRYAIVIICILFVTSGFISNFKYFKKFNFKINDFGVSDTIEFLKDNGLSYGYGPYWGSNANAVTAASMFQIRIRPVGFNRTDGTMVWGKRFQSSRRWYRPENIPKGLDEYFVIVAPDGEVCPDVNLCLSGLTRQFGKPVRRIKWGDNAFILVWDHPLIGYGRPTGQ